MAGIYIKGMKTPEKCEDCRFWDGHINGCQVVHMITLRRIHQEKPSWCPLVEVPDHGDLIDRDALTSVTKMTDGYGEWVPSTKYKGFLTCSICEDCYIESWSNMERKWKYCPQCGVRMI